jgi:hypothetical protein
MQYFAPFDIGPKRKLTPEGFMLCLDVPIARTGRMIYTNKDFPDLEAGRDGTIQVDRDEQELFNPIAISSTNGKAVTVNHPPDGSLISPTIYKQVTKGSVLNPRRGEGELADCIVCDLLIQQADGIDALHNGFSQVSWGYDAKYEPTGVPGYYTQTKLIGNHVALVKNGRCGTRCAVGDSADEPMTVTCDCAGTCECKHGEDDMATKRAKILSTMDALLKEAMPDMVESPDATVPGPHADEMPPTGGKEGGDTHIHVHVNGSNPGVSPEPTDDDSDPNAIPGADPGVGDPTAGEEPDSNAPAAAAGIAEIQKTLEGILKRLDALEGGGPSKQADAEMTPEAAEAAAAEEGEDTNDSMIPRRRKTKDADSPDPAMAIIEGGENPIKGAGAITTNEGRGRVSTGKEGAADVKMEPGDSPLDTSRATTDSAGRVVDRDSKHLQRDMQDVVSRAAILGTQLTFPTFDAAATATMTIGRIANYRRRVLKEAFGSKKHTDEVRKYFPTLATLDAASVDAVAMAFTGVTEAAARRNNTIISNLRHVQMTTPGGGVKPLTGAEINARNAARWAN